MRVIVFFFDNRVIRKVNPSLEVKLGFEPLLFVKKQMKK